MRLLRMAAGAPGKAWRMAQTGALEIDDLVHGLVQGLPRIDEAAMLAVTDGFRGAEGAARFNLILERLADQVRTRASARALAGDARGLDAWADAWELLTRLPRDAEALNLDRADAFWTALSRLRAIA